MKLKFGLLFVSLLIEKHRDLKQTITNFLLSETIWKINYMVGGNHIFMLQTYKDVQKISTCTQWQCIDCSYLTMIGLDETLV